MFGVRSGTYRRPLFGRFGPYVVAGICGYELAALALDGVPTVSDLVRRHRLAGGLVLAALAHHWFIEQ